MELWESYATIKPAIVAIVKRISKYKDIPEIIATGFVVDGHLGLIATNNHVLKAFSSLPRLKLENEDVWPASVMFLHASEAGLSPVTMEVKAALSFSLSQEPDYGPKQPDMAFLRVGFTNLPEGTLDTESPLLEGEEVATAGYPLGDWPLRDDATKVMYIAPTLKRGIIGAVLPFQSDNPYGFLVNSLSQPGQSGSPIFDPKTAKIRGILHSGIDGTDITYALPSKYLGEALTQARNAKELTRHDIGEIIDFNEFVQSGLERIKRGERDQPRTVTETDIFDPEKS